MTTIQDIAKRIGVSAATVSRVLNGYPDVNPATRSKVQQAIAEYGYSPGALNRGRDNTRSNAIGVFYTAGGYGELVHPFFQDVLDSFKQVIGRDGFDVLFFDVESQEHVAESFETRAKMRHVDGLLLVSIPRTDTRASSLSVGQIPTMSIDLDLAGAKAGYVCSDNVGGATQAMEYLISMFHTKIAFIGDKFNTKPGHDRLVGYQNTLVAHGLRFRPEWVLDGDFLESGGYEATKTLLQSEERPTAIFCAGDLMAVGAMRAIRESGLKVGDDVSVIGFDDILIASYVSPALTTVRQRRREIGSRAAESLLQLIAEPHIVPPIVTVPTDMVVRESVKRPRGATQDERSTSTTKTRRRASSEHSVQESVQI